MALLANRDGAVKQWLCFYEISFAVVKPAQIVERRRRTLIVRAGQPFQQMQRTLFDYFGL